MLAAYGITIAAALVGLAIWGVVLFALKQPPNRPFLLVLILAEVEIFVLAMVVVIAMVAGTIASSVPLLGYLLLSLVLLPLVVRPGAGDSRTRWDSATIGAVCIAVAVVVLRIITLQ